MLLPRHGTDVVAHPLQNNGVVPTTASQDLINSSRINNLHLSVKFHENPHSVLVILLQHSHTKRTDGQTHTVTQAISLFFY